MATFDWRSSEAYDLSKEGDPDVGWECLRRSSDYQKSYEGLSHPEASVPSGFRNDWGLVFRG